MTECVLSEHLIGALTLTPHQPFLCVRVYTALGERVQSLMEWSTLHNLGKLSEHHTMRLL